MKAGSGLAKGRYASPELAAEAVRLALSNAGEERADQVILFLGQDFGRIVQASLLAAARASGCMEVCGSTSRGVFTERGWEIDQPAAAALVFSGSDSAPSDDAKGICFSSHGFLPDNPSMPIHAGLHDMHGSFWNHTRIQEPPCLEVKLRSLQGQVAISDGLRALGGAISIEASQDYELRRLGGQTAIDSVKRLLPPELKQQPPWHRLALLRQAGIPACTVLSANPDGSLMLSATLVPGEEVRWAIRQPLSAEENMRQTLNAAVNPKKPPFFALMFSCIGRGPLFYGGEDRDLVAFTERFPGTPLLGAYGDGQIGVVNGNSVLFQNSVITLLLEEKHV